MTQVFDQWYVRVGEQSYGPYTDAMMVRFVAEGRVTSVSEISADPAAGFFHAARYADFTRWSAPASLKRGLESQSGVLDGAAVQGSDQVTRHLVMAELRSGQSMGFLRQLQTYRQCTRIGDTVWLIDGAGDTDALTFALRKTLNPVDRMFVVDITGQPTGQSGFIDMSKGARA